MGLVVLAGLKRSPLLVTMPIKHGRSRYVHARCRCSICCNAEHAYAVTRRRRLRKHYIAYLGGRCIVCGSKKSLEFHHKIPNEKRFSIGQSMFWAPDRVYAELDKCELRCHKHHLKAHEAKHGTESRYIHHECRCDACCAANREGGRRRWHAEGKEERNAMRRIKRAARAERLCVPQNRT